jgi:hypothetical protein
MEIEQFRASIMQALLPMVKQMDESAIRQYIEQMSNLSSDFKQKILGELLAYKKSS